MALLNSTLGNGRYGIELTYTNLNMIELARNENSIYYNKLYNTLFNNWKNKIKSITDIEKINGGKGVEWLPPSVDDHGYEKIGLKLSNTMEVYLHSDDWVYEVGSSPITTNFLKSNLDLLQTVIFDTAASIGLRPHSRIGCGHLHLEYISHFNNNKKLLRNFIVDLVNRPLLFLGGLSLDLLNSPPISILPEQYQHAMKDVIKDFDTNPDSTIASLISDINTKVYKESYINRKADELTDFNKRQSKYHAINFLHEQTLEIRGIRPQQSAQHLLDYMTLFENRIEQIRLSTLNGELIPLHFDNLRDKVSWSVSRNMESYVINIESIVIIDALKKYISDSGLPDTYYRSLVTNELFSRHAEDVDKLEVLPHGTLLGTTACGVSGYAANYSNYINMKPEDFKNYENGLYTGIKYQCVEYARRYWLHHYGVLLCNIPMAFDIWNQSFVLKTPVKDNKIVPLHHYRNGGVEPPMVGDYLIYDRNPELFTGHVAVVVEVGLTYIRIAEQNRFNGRIWPGPYAFEIPYHVSSLIDDENNEIVSHFVDDVDCLELLGWVRLQHGTVLDRPIWKPRITVDETNLDPEAPENWIKIQKFLDSRPTGVFGPSDISVLQHFLNDHNVDNPSDLLEIKVGVETFDKQTISILQRFLNNHWKLCAPDAVRADEDGFFELEVDGEFGLETKKALYRLAGRVGTHQEFEFASKSA